MRARAVYLIAAALIVASWLANYGYYRYYRLPEPGFLRHYIETTYTPSVAFDLLYVANKDDKRKPVSATAEGLEALRFYPVQVHQELRRQTIYALRGYFDENRMQERQEGEPLRLNALKVQYSDGSVREENVGEIIAYRPAWPPDKTKEPPVRFSSGRGSSDNSGSAAVTAVRPATLSGVSSAWLEKLGGAFRYEIKANDTHGMPQQPSSATVPLEMDTGQMLSLDYRFQLKEAADVLSVYNVQLREHFTEPDGSKYDYIVFANYTPYPTDAQMRAYVREMRGRAE
ncbi:hypothetical protein B1A99_04310 [Cohnella sp. CIP 111063]|uniref:hypothetical protein n=1 Tax=unclassified Cohnella TaxID=2636738 RepID=UPI000B8C2E64|nr:MULTISPECIES: hypothetical protein [unclassified Cohnella]OXS61836.1 hypothetical protein B1A99_04310 [Cohnella sp. CIP 111063]PRX74280.1 hypothetical protein B0G52_102307 [Cohnella sp. SGD-V74]